MSEDKNKVNEEIVDENAENTEEDNTVENVESDANSESEVEEINDDTEDSESDDTEGEDVDTEEDADVTEEGDSEESEDESPTDDGDDSNTDSNESPDADDTDIEDEDEEEVEEEPVAKDPLDEVFDKIPAKAMKELLENPDKYVPNVRGAIAPYRYQMEEEQYDTCMIEGLSFLFKFMKPKQLLVDMYSTYKKKVTFR
jgi:hypothetical protein